MLLGSKVLESLDLASCFPCTRMELSGWVRTWWRFLKICLLQYSGYWCTVHTCNSSGLKPCTSKVISNFSSSSLTRITWELPSEAQCDDWGRSGIIHLGMDVVGWRISDPVVALDVDELDWKLSEVFLLLDIDTCLETIYESRCLCMYLPLRTQATRGVKRRLIHFRPKVFGIFHHLSPHILEILEKQRHLDIKVQMMPFLSTHPPSRWKVRILPKGVPERDWYHWRHTFSSYLLFPPKLSSALKETERYWPLLANGIITFSGSQF